jgi:hypothetical protein
VDISGDATGSLSVSGTSEDGGTSSHPSTVVAIVGYPSTGGSIVLEITDALNGACISTQVVALPSNCVSCGIVGTFNEQDAVVTAIFDFLGNPVVAGSYDMTQLADRNLLANDAEAELVDLGANICAGADGVLVARSGGYSGMRANQDSGQFVDINYAEVTSSEWVGTLKTYFGACGCATGRLCDYQAAVDFSTMILADAFVKMVVTFGDTGATYSNSVVLDFGDITDGVSPSELTAAAAALKLALENSGCAPTVGTVTIAFDSITEIFTITILGTNAALGLVNASTTDGLTSDLFTEFTQSNCV